MTYRMEDQMDTIEAEARPDPADDQQPGGGATQRARDVVSDVTDAARSAVETTAPAVRDAADAARQAVQTHAPAVLEAGRSTAESAYGQVRRARDEQLAMWTAFAAGLVTGFIVARVPRPLLILALIPLAIFGGTLLGRKVPLIGRAMGGTD